MAGKSQIEWTEHTWNPIARCSGVSPGGSAMRQPLYAGLTRLSKGRAVWSDIMRQALDYELLAPLRRKTPTTYFVNSMSDLFHEAVPDEWIDRVFAVMALAPQHTFQVLTKRSARMRAYFAGIDEMPDEPAARDALIEGAAQAIWAARNPGKDPSQWLAVHMPLPNVWLGVSTERQQEADERVPDLLATPAAVRFISAEPLLGPIDLKRWAPTGRWGKSPSGERIFVPTYFMTKCEHCGWVGSSELCGVENSFGDDSDVYCAECHRSICAQDLPGLDWVIVGGESGPGARPMHPDWARSLRDQCAAAGVPFFFKQWGEFLPVGQHLPGCGKIHGATSVKPGRMKLHYAGTPKQPPKHAFAERGVEVTSTADGRLTCNVGKKAAGRLLDGVEHNAMPVRP